MQPSLCFSAFTVTEPKQITFELLMRVAENQAGTYTHTFKYMLQTRTEIEEKWENTWHHIHGHLWSHPPSLSGNVCGGGSLN